MYYNEVNRGRRNKRDRLENFEDTGNLENDWEKQIREKKMERREMEEQEKLELLKTYQNNTFGIGNRKKNVGGREKMGRERNKGGGNEQNFGGTKNLFGSKENDVFNQVHTNEVKHKSKRELMYKRKKREFLAKKMGKQIDDFEVPQNRPEIERKSKRDQVYEQKFREKMNKRRMEEEKVSMSQEFSPRRKNYDPRKEIRKNFEREENFRPPENYPPHRDVEENREENFAAPKKREEREENFNLKDLGGRFQEETHKKKPKQEEGSFFDRFGGHDHQRMMQKRFNHRDTRVDHSHDKKDLHSRLHNEGGQGGSENPMDTPQNRKALSYKEELDRQIQINRQKREESLMRRRNPNFVPKPEHRNKYPGGGGMDQPKKRLRKTRSIRRDFLKKQEQDEYRRQLDEQRRNKRMPNVRDARDVRGGQRESPRKRGGGGFFDKFGSDKKSKRERYAQDLKRQIEMNKKKREESINYRRNPNFKYDRKYQHKLHRREEDSGFQGRRIQSGRRARPSQGGRDGRIGRRRSSFHEGRTERPVKKFNENYNRRRSDGSYLRRREPVYEEAEEQYEHEGNGDDSESGYGNEYVPSQRGRNYPAIPEENIPRGRGGRRAQRRVQFVEERRRPERIERPVREDIRQRENFGGGSPSQRKGFMGNVAGMFDGRSLSEQEKRKQKNLQYARELKAQMKEREDKRKKEKENREKQDVVDEKNIKQYLNVLKKRDEDERVRKHGKVTSHVANVGDGKTNQQGGTGGVVMVSPPPQDVGGGREVGGNVEFGGKKRTGIHKVTDVFTAPPKQPQGGGGPIRGALKYSDPNEMQRRKVQMEKRRLLLVELEKQKQEKIERKRLEDEKIKLQEKKDEERLQRYHEEEKRKLEEEERKKKEKLDKQNEFNQKQAQKKVEVDKKEKDEELFGPPKTNFPVATPPPVQRTPPGNFARVSPPQQKQEEVVEQQQPFQGYNENLNQTHVERRRFNQNSNVGRREFNHNQGGFTQNQPQPPSKPTSDFNVKNFFSEFKEELMDAIKHEQVDSFKKEQEKIKEQITNMVKETLKENESVLNDKKKLAEVTKELMEELNSLKKKKMVVEEKMREQNKRETPTSRRRFDPPESTVEEEEEEVEERVRSGYRSRKTSVSKKKRRTRKRTKPKSKWRKRKMKSIPSKSEVSHGVEKEDLKIIEKSPSEYFDEKREEYLQSRQREEESEEEEDELDLDMLENEANERNPESFSQFGRNSEIEKSMIGESKFILPTKKSRKKVREEKKKKSYVPSVVDSDYSSTSLFKLSKKTSERCNDLDMILTDDNSDRKKEMIKKYIQKVPENFSVVGEPTEVGIEEDHEHENRPDSVQSNFDTLVSRTEFFDEELEESMVQRKRKKSTKSKIALIEQSLPSESRFLKMMKGEM